MSLLQNNINNYCVASHGVSPSSRAGPLSYNTFMMTVWLRESVAQVMCPGTLCRAAQSTTSVRLFPPYPTYDIHK